MKAATLLLVLADTINLLKTAGLITSTGDFGDFSNIQQDTNIIKGVEAVLTQHGVAIPGRVDQILNLIPLVAGIIKG